MGKIRSICWSVVQQQISSVSILVLNMSRIGRQCCGQNNDFGEEISKLVLLVEWVQDRAYKLQKEWIRQKQHLGLYLCWVCSRSLLLLMLKVCLFKQYVFCQVSLHLKSPRSFFSQVSYSVNYSLGKEWYRVDMGLINKCLNRCWKQWAEDWGSVW